VDEVYATDEQPGTVDVWLMAECRSGWPLYGLESAGMRHRGDNIDTVLRKAAWNSSRPYPINGGNEYDWLAREQLPLLPIWPGFAINTIFYAAILWMLCLGFGAVRRRRRLKRGLCVKCAYDLRGTSSGVCPECGASMQNRAHTRGCASAAASCSRHDAPR